MKRGPRPVGERQVAEPTEIEREVRSGWATASVSA